MKQIQIPYAGIFFLLLTIIGCDKKGSSPPDVQSNLAQQRLELASGVSDHFILPGFASLQDETEGLVTSLAKFQSEINQQNLESFRFQLQKTWLSWQKVEPFVFGPSETLALRSALNTYPTNVEKIQTNIQRSEYSLGSFSQLDAGGFPALDYLINNQEETDEEKLQSYQNESGKLQYLSDVVAFVDQNISEVTELWKNGDFLDKFRSDASGGTDIGSAMGILINAFDLHFQRFLRDGKVAIPAGIRSAGIIRPTATEAYYGGYSLALLKEALINYQNIFSGSGLDGQKFNSFYFYLTALNREDLVTILENEFNLALAQVDALSDPLSDQIMTDVEPVTTLFILLQDIVTTIKADMISAMGITLTNQDNDGD